MVKVELVSSDYNGGSGEYIAVLRESEGDIYFKVNLTSEDYRDLKILMSGEYPEKKTMYQRYMESIEALGFTPMSIDFGIMIDSDDYSIYCLLVVEDPEENTYHLGLNPEQGIILSEAEGIEMFVTPELLESVDMFNDLSCTLDENLEKVDRESLRLMRMPIEKVQKILDEAIRDEDYEKAGKCRDELGRRKDKNKN